MNSKKKYDKSYANSMQKINRVSKPANVFFSIIFIMMSLCCVIPLIFVIIISFTDQSSIRMNGYSFIPKKLSLQAYVSLFQNSSVVLHSFFISIFVTVIGTILGILLNSLMGYALSRRKFYFRKAYTMLVFIPMLFNGGMVATYLIITRVLFMKDTIWALIFPLAVNSFYIIVLRTFFTSTVPDSVIESAKIDGATQFRIFFSIVFPISLPAMATIGLFLSFGYWNDWQCALLYVSGTSTLWPLQYVLIGIEQDLEFLARNPNMSGMDQAQILKNLPEDGVRMALVVLTVLPIACSYPFFQKYFVSGLTVGSIKG